MKEWSEIYKCYKLICTPVIRPDGTFATNLVIQKDLRSEVREIAVKVVPDTFVTEQEAANAGRIAGRLWVDDNE